MNRNHPAFMPILATITGIALYSAMDAAMKSASLAVGAFSAFFLRCALGFVLSAPIWAIRGARMPPRDALRIHLVRGVIGALMGLSFFFALVRLPLAEAIAIAFIAPLIALFLAAVILGETIRPTAIIASLLGLTGVVVIVAGRLGGAALDDEAAIGFAAVTFSATLYAWNLILQRQQAQLADPLEISVFQNGVAAAVLALGVPFLLVWPDAEAWRDIALGAVLTIAALMCLSWAYARAEAQHLVPVEYTGFLWAALFGWMLFSETVSSSTLAGATLIVAGCWIAIRTPRAMPTP